MDLHQIIKESVNSVILDSIISEAIENGIAINEDKKKNRGSRNLAQVRNQNQVNRNKSALQEATNTQANGTTQNQQQPSVDFSQFADQLRQLIGNGIDPSPVQNNQEAVQHIADLNNFVFNVITAIDNGNIDSTNTPAAGGNYRSKYSSPYEKTKGDVKYDAYNQASQGIAGLAGEVGDAPINLANQWGMKLDTPFNGLGKEFSSAHNQGINQFQNYANQKKYADAQRAAKTGQGGVDLVYLMRSVNEGCYPMLQATYHQIDKSSGGIFGAIPEVSQCYQILQNLLNYVPNYTNTQNQQGQKQPSSSTNTPQGTTPPAGQGNGGSSQGSTGQGNTGTPSTPATPTTPSTPATPNTPNTPTTPSTPTTTPNTKTVNGASKPKTISFDENRLTSQYEKKLIELDETGWTKPVYNEIAKKYRGKTLKNMRDFVSGLEKILGECVDALESGSIKASDERRTQIKPVTKVLGLDYDTRGDVSFYELKKDYVNINNATGNYLQKLNPVGKIMEALIGLQKEMQKKNMIDKQPTSRDLNRQFK